MKPLTKLYADLLDAKKNAINSDRAAHFYGENLYPAMEDEIKACHKALEQMSKFLQQERMKTAVAQKRERCIADSSLE